MTKLWNYVNVMSLTDRVSVQLEINYSLPPGHLIRSAVGLLEETIADRVFATFSLICRMTTVRHECT